MFVVALQTIVSNELHVIHMLSPHGHSGNGRVGYCRTSDTIFEMETSAIYGLGKLLGHYFLSLNAIIANRVSKEFSKDAAT